MTGGFITATERNDFTARLYVEYRALEAENARLREAIAACRERDAEPDATGGR